ncbi:MAG TPA: hypothetical protein VEF90_17645 [Xanthobacteraceae bacterium]|nr:hypothetical protein [Xanthobacteraceae bacterium]
MTSKRYQRWTKERAALAAFLAGQGATHAEIAEHPEIATTKQAVSNQLWKRRVGRTPKGHRVAAVRIPVEVEAAFRRAAQARLISTETLARRLMLIAGGDAALLDNVLDDGVSTPLEMKEAA